MSAENSRTICATLLAHHLMYVFPSFCHLTSRSLGKNRSQLSVIFDVIGTPQLDDLPHLDENTAALLSNLAPRTPQVKVMTHC
jgi:hypothetical protein